MQGMMSSLRTLLLTLPAWLALCLTANAQAPNAAHKPKPSYEEWARYFSTNDILGHHRGRGLFWENHPAWVTIIAFAETDGLIDPDEADFLHREHCYGAEITTDGTHRSFRIGRFGMKGGSNSPSPTLLKRVTPLIGKLPADTKTVPPVERCVVVRIEDKVGVRVFLYDMADPPKPFLALLRAIRSSIATWAPRISAVRKTRVHDDESHGVFALSPDGKQIAVASLNGPMHLWDSTTLRAERDVAMPYGGSPEDIAFSPDGSLAFINDGFDCQIFSTQNWQHLETLHEDHIGRFYPSLTSPQFSADRRYAVFRCTSMSVRIFDTQTWKPRKAMPGVPPLTVAWVPAPKGPLAIIQNTDSQIILWDSAQSRKVAMLDDFARIERVAFSPDQTRVAVATRHRLDGKYWTPCRVRLWDCSSGKLITELHPFPNDQCENITSILWSPDGRDVVVPVCGRLWSRATIKIWDVATGRHRGTLDGMEGKPCGAAILPGGERLIASTNKGILYEWDLADALRKIRDFEADLPRNSNTPH